MGGSNRLIGLKFLHGTTQIVKVLGENVSNINQHFLDIFFHPKSVAVVGATNNVKAINFYLAANLVNLKFHGKISTTFPSLVNEWCKITLFMYIPLIFIIFSHCVFKHF